MADEARGNSGAWEDEEVKEAAPSRSMAKQVPRKVWASPRLRCLVQAGGGQMIEEHASRLGKGRRRGQEETARAIAADAIQANVRGIQADNMPCDRTFIAANRAP